MSWVFKREILIFPRKFLYKMKTFRAQHITFFFYQNTNARVQGELSHCPQNCYQGKISSTSEPWKNTSKETTGVSWLCASPFTHGGNVHEKNL